MSNIQITRLLAGKCTLGVTLTLHPFGNTGILWSSSFPSWDFFLNQPLRFLDIMCVLHGLVTPLPRVPPMITSCECWKRCGARCSNQRDHFLSRGKSSPNSLDGDNDDNDIIEVKVVRGRRNDDRGQDIHKKCSPKVNNNAF